MVTRRLIVPLVAAAALGSACTGASPGADKAGDVRGETIVLRMASTPWSLEDVPPIADFRRNVEALSSGTIRINVVDQWGDYAPDAEVQVVRAVASGKADLGWAGSRVFDTLGVPTFQALSAPMLIDSYPLEDAVLRSAAPSQMLPILTRIGVTGLAVLGDELRFPISIHRPLLTPADWRAVAVGTYRSQVQEDAIRALGARPVEAFGAFRSHDLANGTIQAFELDLRRYARQGLAAQAPYVAANVALWPEFNVLFANPSRLSSLTDQQRQWLEQAARDAADTSVGTARESDPSIGRACSMGARFASATEADLAAIRHSFAVVYEAIETDPRTRAFVQQIQRLKDSARPSPAPDIPAGCALTV
jgi:TRAP-type C4-dicarboxylate transport system substrate-binding protein